LHRYSAYAEKIIEAGEGDGMVFPAVYRPARGLRNAGGDDRLMGIVRTNECVCCGVMLGSGTLLAVVEALVPDSLWERVTPLSPACVRHGVTGIPGGSRGTIERHWQGSRSCSRPGSAGTNCAATWSVCSGVTTRRIFWTS
jgi:hypothetical protein